MKCPNEIVVVMREEDLLKDMDGYDEDSYDEDSIDWLAHEVGTSMETLEVDNWEDVDELMNGTYKDYLFADEDVATGYYVWKDPNYIFEV